MRVGRRGRRRARRSTRLWARSLPRRPTRSLEPLFVDYRAGADAELMLDTVTRLRADVVIVFRPETVPPGLFAGLDALTVGWSTEPLPRGRRNVHPDLSWRLSELALV